MPASTSFRTASDLPLTGDGVATRKNFAFATNSAEAAAVVAVWREKCMVIYDVELVILSGGRDDDN